jgi:hypothetical protein
VVSLAKGESPVGFFRDPHFEYQFVDSSRYAVQSYTFEISKETRDAVLDAAQHFVATHPNYNYFDESICTDFTLALLHVAVPNTDRAVRRRDADAWTNRLALMVSLVRRSHFPLLLILVLVLTQTLPGYRIDVLAQGASTENNCNASNADFGADLKRLSDTIKQVQDIPREFLQRHFSGCTIENARELLVKNGFDAEELGREFDDSQPPKVIPREILTEKNIRTIGELRSFNCRIILQTDASNRFSARGFFYFDGP